MAARTAPTAAFAAAVLEALNPLLESHDANAVTSVVTAIRDANPPPTVLATSLYAFSKLVLSLPDAAKAFRNVVHSLVSTTLLPRDVLYEAIDVETHQLFEPTIARPQEQKRMRTRLWFTQTRFNLFREESEGYAKVMALMWETVATPENVDPTAVVEALLALIGQFSLDTNRVIELVLSAATDVITDQKKRAGNIPFDHRLPPLFVKLLDEFPRDHVFSVVGAMLQSYHPMSVVTSEVLSESAASKAAASPEGSAAPAAGEPEKSASEARAAALKTPEAFYYLIGILIREGRMRISDVWHDMYPRDDTELARKFLAYEEELQALSKHVASPNAGRSPIAQTPALYARSGTGASERDIFSQYKFVTAGPFAQVACQKLHFIFVLIIMCRVDDVLDAILSLGVNGEHIDIAAHPVIAQALAAFAEALLNPLLIRKFPGFYRGNNHITEAIGRLGGRANRCPCTVATTDELLDEDEDGAGAVILRILQVLGPHARTAPGLLQALCRILKGRDEPRAIAIMQDVVLPASSLLQSNVGLANDIWEVLRNWPHTVRWQLYGNLQNVVSETCAVYQVVANRASYEMRYVLKRLTKETQKQHVTTISKITRGQALPAFSAAIDRIQGYPPDPVTISPVIDSCQDCSNLAVDILLFLIIDRMADSRRSRLKEDGINIAQWYATLSLFLGLCLRKLPVNSQQIEGVLSFLYTKLVLDQEALLITALSDVIKCVADIEIETNLTAKQIEAQGGGYQLRTAVSGIWGRLQPDMKLVGHAFDTKLEREKRGAVIALLTAFERTGMHVPIAIAIAQMSRDAIYQEDLRTMPLKLGANIVDRARSSLSQLSQFFASSPATNAWEKELGADIWCPFRKLGLADLVGEMGVLTPFAIVLMSPVVNFLASCPSGDELNSKSITGKPNEVTNDVEVSSLGDKNSANAKGTGDVESEELTGRSEKGDAGASRESPGDVRKSSSAPLDEMDCDVALNAREKQSTLAFANIIARRTHGFVSAEFARAFWTLKLDDISVPFEMYDSEKKRLLVVKDMWEKEVDRNRRHNNHVDGDRRRRCEAEFRRIRDFLDSLEAEKAAFMQKQASTLESLKATSGLLCILREVQTQADKERAVKFILQECIVPRCKVSSCDAIFCSKFMLLMLELDLPVICFSAYYEGLLKLTPVVLSSCSESEALSFARLLKEVLTTLEKWRSNRKTFDSEAASEKKFGFRDLETAGAKPLRHEQYCQWLFDIHEELADGLCHVLASDEYLYARNSICVLAGIADVFPKVSEHSSKIEECVAKLTASELPDIRLSSTGVLARLKSGKAKRLPRHVFKLKPSSGGSASAAGGNAKRKPPSQHPEPKSAASASSKDLKPTGASVVQPKQKVESQPMDNAPTANGSLKVAPTSDTSRKVEAEKANLNPNAKEFVPPTMNSVARGGEDKTSVASSTGKRGRDTGTGLRNGPREEQVASTGQKASESEPPSKRSKGGDVRRGDAGRNVTSAKAPDAKPPIRDDAGRTSDGQGPPVQKTPIPTTPVQKVSGQKPPPPSRDAPGRDSGGGDNPNRGSSGPSGRNGAIREDPGRDTPSRGAGSRETSVRSPSRREAPGRSPPRRGEAPGRSPSRREAPTRSPPSRDPASRGPAGREPSGRTVAGRDSSGRSPPRRDAPGRSSPRRDPPGRKPVGRDSQPRNSAGRDPSSRVPAGRDGPGRDGISREDSGRGAPKRESPSQNLQRRSSRGDVPTRDTNGISGKDSMRRRRGPDGQGSYQFSGPGDSRMPARETQEYDEPFGDGHGVKRRREINPQRDSYSFDGEGRRPTRQRTDQGLYRERAPSREDPPNARFNGPQSPPRDSSRFDNSFSGQPPPGKAGWNDHGRSRSHDGLHDMRPGSGGGPRRRDLELDQGAGWDSRPNERPLDFEGRDRQLGRIRDEGRNGDYNSYEERGANRGGDRYRERRNSGRDDRGSRDRAFGRRNHGRLSGRRRP